MDAQLIGDPLDRAPGALRIRQSLPSQPRGTITKLDRILPLPHDSDSFPPCITASIKPGAQQTQEE